MKPALDETKFKDPVIEVVSNVTGVPVKRERERRGRGRGLIMEMNPKSHPYQIKQSSEIGLLLARQITNTVQWQRSIRYALDDDVHDWMVLGPSRVLGNLLRKEHPNESIKSISTADEIKALGEMLVRKRV